MSITVIYDSIRAASLTADDILDGHAYECESTDIIYIGNSFGEVRAYSICGNAVLFKTDTNRFREINLEIRIV